MKFLPFFSLIVFASLLFSCDRSLEQQNVTEESIARQDSIDESLSQKKDSIAFVIVNNLRLRKQQHLNAEVIQILKENEKLVFLGDTSKNQESITLRGTATKAPFYKVKTASGNIGWVYGGAISFKNQKEKEPYRAVIAFITRSENLDVKTISDWSTYSSEALDMARKAGIYTAFADKDFNRVRIEDRQGNFLDEINILSYAGRYNCGLVCIKSDTAPHFISLTNQMSSELTDFYKLKNKEL